MPGEDAYQPGQYVVVDLDLRGFRYRGLARVVLKRAVKAVQFRHCKQEYTVSPCWEREVMPRKEQHPCNASD